MGLFERSLHGLRPEVWVIMLPLRRDPGHLRCDLENIGQLTFRSGWIVSPMAAEPKCHDSEKGAIKQAMRYGGRGVRVDSEQLEKRLPRKQPNRGKRSNHGLFPRFNLI